MSYPTALRMFRQIRTLLGQDDEILTGEVEADETFVGGKPRAGKPMSIAEHSARKTVVFAAIKRGGHVKATIIPDTKAVTLATRRAGSCYLRRRSTPTSTWAIARSAASTPTTSACTTR